MYLFMDMCVLCVFIFMGVHVFVRVSIDGYLFFLIALFVASCQTIISFLLLYKDYTDFQNLHAIFI